jgi:hypothetical protein
MSGRARCVFAGLLFAAAALGAQEANEEDIFSAEAFDQSVAESRREEQANRLNYLVGGTFLWSNSVAAGAAFDGYAAACAFASKAFVRLTVPSYGALYLGYILRHTLYQGDGGALDTGSSAAAVADLFENTFELSEFYLSFDLAKKVFFRVGNQLLAWGPSFIWTPVDFVNLQRLDPLASVDLRVGKPGLRVHVPMRNSNLFLFADFSRTVDTAEPGVRELARTALAARWDLTALGYEFGLSGYFGYELPASFGLDLSGRLVGFDVYGEAALTADLTDENVDYAASLGLQRTFGELKDWSFQAEGFYQSVGGSDPLYLGQWYAYAALAKENLFSDFLDATLSGLWNISDLSYTVRLACAFDPVGFLPFTLTLSRLGGGAGKEFTAFTGGNAFSASFEARFEF